MVGALSDVPRFADAVGETPRQVGVKSKIRSRRHRWIATWQTPSTAASGRLPLDNAPFGGKHVTPIPALLRHRATDRLARPEGTHVYSLHCWGPVIAGATPPPEGHFTSIASGSGYCAMNDFGTVTCWGSIYAVPPVGVRFRDLAGGITHWCGIAFDRTAICWGAGYGGATLPPEGRFAMLAAGRWHSCGLRFDGSLECWGRSWTVPPPSDVEEIAYPTGQAG